MKDFTSHFCRAAAFAALLLLILAPAMYSSAQSINNKIDFSRDKQFAAAENSGQKTVLVSTTVVISQVYGGAGCGTAGCSTYRNDYIELFNRGNAPQSLNGWSVQYAAASGTAWQVTNLTNVTLQPGQYYLVAEGAGANGVNNIPTPDATGTVAMSATAAKVALVSATTALSGSCPTSPTIVDLVGYGATASCTEGGVSAPPPSTTTAAVRAGGGCTDTDNNGTDFSATTPNARNTATALSPCAAPTAAPATVAGRVLTSGGRGVSNVLVSLTDALGVMRTTRTNPFGHYRFDGIAAGEVYVLAAKHKTYSFAAAVLDVSENLTDVTLTAIEP